MTSNATKLVAQWLERNGVRPQLERLVRAWNVHELLGIDLADQLRDLVREQADKASVDVPLDEVDWSLLAERYAQEICGVDEDELTRRRARYSI